MDAARCFIPSLLPRRLAPRVALMGACAMAGCAGSREPVEKPRAERPTTQQFGMQEEALGGVAARPAAPVPVKEGPAPLVYLVESTATLRIMDQSANRFLAETVASPRTIVRVDERNGIIAGSDQLVAGPLPPGRRYVILVVPDDVNVLRHGNVQPLPTKRREAIEERQQQQPKRQ